MENIQLTTECLKAVNSWGSTIYQNVCNGSVSTVPWGSMDYLGAIGLIIFFGLIIFIFTYMLWDTMMY